MNAKKMPQPSTLPTLNTRRYPRTTQEAFGPYARARDIKPMPEPGTDYSVAWSVAMIVVSIAALAVVWWQS